ncbi:hypothetical protein [Streptomyces sp. NBC_01304]|uniref:hypothetical protein n=1 Tax=Streptomyces sp. NBC_01304 TaxID=2903818 RepID=UPI002E110A25|nr:hypothetical protein OG430_48605 [Streptomyces sp. NBC_01304]
MSGYDDLSLTGSITLDPPLPVSEFGPAYTKLLNSGLALPTYSGDTTVQAMTGVTFPEDVSADAGFWFTMLRRLEDLARQHARTLASAATYTSDERGRGGLLIDGGGHFHLVRDEEDRGLHLARTCEFCLHNYHYRAGAFDVEATDDDQVRLGETVCGPFTVFPVLCDQHGEIACPPTRPEALFRREQHLIEKHTPRPLPLGAAPVEDRLLEEVLEHIAEAGRQLRDARHFAGQAGRAGGAVRRRDVAREHVRQAVAALRAHPAPDVCEALVHLLVEHRAGR